MPSPSHRPHTFTAKRLFTDRDAARQLFTEQCSRTQGRDEYRILNYSGIGGQGKSALCGQFEARLMQLQAQGNNLLAWAKVNFEEAGMHAVITLTRQVIWKSRSLFNSRSATNLVKEQRSTISDK